tara:strand:+ start:1473 stop:1982 length:510 start_codon:yes stop_codon:yes gene_type:complete
MKNLKHSNKVPKPMQPYVEKIQLLTDEFCFKYLDEDYQILTHKLIATLARKRPSPLTSGKSNVWAGAVINALGTINVLFDKSNIPYVTADQIAENFNTSKSTLRNKARQVREMLKMNNFDYKWLLPSKIKNNSMAWMIKIDGFIIDARTLEPEIQKMAYEKGLIPFVCT